MEQVLTIDEVFATEYDRLVRALAVAFDAASAADAVQDAFIAADRRWGKISNYDDPVGWIRRVAVNKLRNGRRNRLRRTEILATIRPVADDDLTVALLDLRTAVHALPTKQRLAITLHYLGGLTVDEVAIALGSAPGTVKSNLHDARIRLRGQLEDDRHV